MKRWWNDRTRRFRVWLASLGVSDSPIELDPAADPEEDFYGSAFGFPSPTGIVSDINPF